MVLGGGWCVPLCSSLYDASVDKLCMRPADIQEITAMSNCLGLVFCSVEACIDAYCYPFMRLWAIHYWMLQDCIPGSLPAYSLYSMKGLEAKAVHCSGAFFLLWALGSQFSFHHPLAHVQPFLHSLYLSPTLPPPLPPYIRPSSFPLAPMLMHFQSGCPLSGRALHVHQAVQSPACKWAQIASHCKLLEISLEGVL